ncbi:MAG TPA: magnesium protoporphyrin IX methyltransferase [Hyphomicrobiaceae bacterium]|nr:magnesium protoporphyrin IX methyltransferase [Hyphomicrobiaceae bacterium]
MPTISYLQRRQELETYFDRTAVDAWARLTTEEPVGRIRATVRAGRNEMRQTMASWLPANLEGRTVLDAGCGTGALAVDLAARGADVLAIDLSPRLVELARARFPEAIGKGRVRFQVGDMLIHGSDRFDHVVAMDSLIHYDDHDIAKVLACLAAAVRRSVVFTFVPRTPLLVAMHAAGRMFPRRDRSPTFRPLGDKTLRRLIATERGLADFSVGRSRYISRGFYTSEAMELIRK